MPPGSNLAERTVRPHAPVWRARSSRPRVLLHTAAAAAVALTALVLTAAPASAARRPGRVPTQAEAAAIVRAVTRSPYTSAVPASAYTVVDIRVARQTPTWALARVQPRTHDFDPATALLHRASAGWRLVDLGTAEVGCGTAPRQVREEFRLSCPPTTVKPTPSTPPTLPTSPRPAPSGVTLHLVLNVPIGV